jgi:pyruvate dehydrogenase E1 component
VLFSIVPNVVTYDPAWAYEVAIIIQNGLKRMYQDNEQIFYYITLYNEIYPMPPMAKDAPEGILKGLYLYKSMPPGSYQGRVQLLGSGTILREALRAQEILAAHYSVAADVWSATSYTQLRRDALEVERDNMLHPGRKAKVPYVVQKLAKTEGPVVAVSDSIRSYPDLISRWVGDRWFCLGTDGYGRSDSRKALRHHFEISAEWVVFAALSRLAAAGKFDPTRLPKVLGDLGLSADKPNPVFT